VKTPAQILAESRVIAVVGASRDPGKEAHTVPRQIASHGWKVIPVNPYTDEIFGVRCYPTLADIPEPVDMVNVFRPSADTPDVARQAVAIGAKALWLQLGIANAQARATAEAAGLDYVEDVCIAVVRAVNALSLRGTP
jgi:predicted CoA-binding protein